MVHKHVAGVIGAAAAIATTIATLSSPQVREAIVYYVKFIARGIVSTAYELRQAVKGIDVKPQQSMLIKKTIKTQGGGYAHIEVP